MKKPKITLKAGELLSFMNTAIKQEIKTLIDECNDSYLLNMIVRQLRDCESYSPQFDSDDDFQD